MLKIAYNLIFHYDLFRPTAMINHVSELSYIVPRQKINYIVLDKDDTLVPVYQFTVKDKRIHQALNQLHHTGHFIIVVSNSVCVDQKNRPQQVRINNGDVFYDLLLTTYPKPYNGQQIEDLMKIQKQLNSSKLEYSKQKVAIIGDRLLTDIHLGNLMGWKSFLVKPLEQTTIKKHGLVVYMMRQFQNFLIARSNFPKYDCSKPVPGDKKQ